MAANYVLLERIELNANAATISFTNIPQSGYTDLKLVLSLRDTNNSGTAYLKFNGVGTGYSAKGLYGTGSAAASENLTNASIQANPSGFTVNTFGNEEIYIPNYTSSNYKSYSIDSVTENNATTAYMEMFAYLWSNTAAITSIEISVASGSIAAYSTASLYGLAAVGTTPAIAPKASGGNITTDGTYWIHTFLTSGTFTPATNLTCDYLVVAGGGGGGSEQGSGGGGGGGIQTATGYSLSVSTNYSVTIGGGGASTANAAGGAGSSSSFNSFTAGGGLGGGKYSASGGNSGTPQSKTGGAAGTPAAYAETGGGGAGAGANGEGGVTNTRGGNGGAGITSSYSGSSLGYAGGGGGGGARDTTSGTATDGGGAGATTTSTNGTAGTANRGGGGGGVRGATTVVGGAGGSGIVIIRYLVA